MSKISKDTNYKWGVKINNLMRIRRCSIILLVGAITMFCLAAFVVPSLTVKIEMVMAGAILIIVFILISVFIWRCPYCNAEMPIMIRPKDFSEQYECPYCGKKIK